MVEDQRNRRKATDLIPGALRVNRPTVTGLVKQQQSSAQFRLDAMLDGFCGPLNQLLGNKRYMLSDYESSSLDCLALGHLAMALIPKLPQPWLAEVMRGRYPQLRKYVENGVKEIFNGRVLVEDAFPRLISELPPSNHEQDRAALPWRAPIRRGFSSAGATILDRALGAMPFYGNNVVPTQPASGTHSASQGSASPASTLIPSLVAASATLVALAGYLIFSSVNHKPEKHRLSDMGEAGAMLAAIDFGGSESSRGEGVPRPEGRLPGGGGG